MGNIDKELKKRLRSLGVERQVESAGVVEAATAEIAKYIPKEDFEVISFKDGILKVEAPSSAAASELRMSFSTIKKSLGNSVKRIRIVMI